MRPNVMEYTYLSLGLPSFQGSLGGQLVKVLGFRPQAEHHVS